MAHPTPGDYISMFLKALEPLQRCAATIAVSLVLLLTSADAAAAAAYNGADAVLPNYKEARTPGFTSSSGLLIVSALIALGVVAVFGYWYWREWQTRRLFDQYRTRAVPAQNPTGPKRKPLIAMRKNSGKPATRSGSGPNAILAQVASTDTQTILITNPPRPPAKNGSMRNGIVYVRAVDELEEVFVDGEFVGMTPATLTLVEGKHRVEVRLADEARFEREIKVIAGSRVDLRPSLQSI